MNARRRLGLIVLAFLLGGVMVGCSWVLGVNDEPVVVGDPSGDAAAAEGDAAPDGAGDAARE